MVRREIEIDEATDHFLTELASNYGGNLNEALADLVRTRERVEAFAEESEMANEQALRAMRDNAEADFREHRTITWEEVKARNGV